MSLDNSYENTKHDRAKVLALVERREIALLNLLFDMRTDFRYINPVVANTRQADRITFKTNLVQYDFYKRSPYFIGSSLWNGLPVDLQKSYSKKVFKTGIKALY